MRAPAYILLSCCVVASSLGSSQVPENYSTLADAGPTGSHPQVDPSLADWLNQFVNVPSPFDLKDSDFAEFQKKQSPLLQAYLQSQKILSKGRWTPPTRSAAAKSVEEEIGRAAAENRAPHELLPYLLGALLDDDTLDEQQRSDFVAKLQQFGPKTCPAKRQILRDFTRDRIKTATATRLIGQLKQSQSFTSGRFRKQSLDFFIRAIPEARREEFAPALLPYVKEFDALTNEHPWLADALDIEVSPTFAKINKNIKKKLCKPAEEAFIALLNGIGSSSSNNVETKGSTASTVANTGNNARIETFQAASSAGTAIERCYRGRGGLPTAAHFWQNSAPALEKAFAFKGKALAKQRIAVLEWTGAKFSDAKETLSTLQSEALPINDRATIAKSIYTLGRIAEEEGDREKAVAYYQKYVEQFPEFENFEPAFTSLVTLRVMDKQWAATKAPLEQIIALQTALPLDDRSTGVMSFALFWAGRIYLELGQNKEALAFWQRLSTEYYSTFYGALGHFLVEQQRGVPHELEPRQTQPFHEDLLRNAFSTEDRATFDRIMTLLKIGRKSDAICETGEINTADRSPDKMLAKATLLHVAGDWLDAIKIYDALPRSFRNTLPAGFERILFPRNFENRVREYTNRLNLDSDLVFALIRQESVYNPTAQSQVGALGLMQLMPATARMEAQRLGKGYVSATERRILNRAAGIPRQVLDPDTNLALGIHHFSRLLSKYKSPVFALSAYNASPNAAEKWFKTIPTYDMLAFIERIPYAETRAYVKLILRNYFYYKRWYDTPSVEAPYLANVTAPFLGTILAKQNRQTPRLDVGRALPVSTLDP